MAPVAPYGLAVPMLLGGRRADALAAILVPAGMKMEPSPRRSARRRRSRCAAA